MIGKNHLEILKNLSVLCGAILLFFWTLPNTIALRHIFLISGSISSLIVLIHFRKFFFDSLNWPFWLLLSSFLWVTFHLFFLSNEFEMQYAEYKGTWFRSIIATPIAYVIGLILSTENPSFKKSPLCKKNRLTLLMLIGISGLFIICTFFYISNSIETGNWRQSRLLFDLYKGKPAFVVSAAIFFPACMLIATQPLKAFTHVWWKILSISGAIICCLCILFANTKNGIFICVFFFFIYIVSLGFKVRQIKIKGMLFIFGALTLMFFLTKNHIQQNPAWISLLSNIRVGVDINNNDYWKNSDIYTLPLNENLSPVDLSTYQRTSWLIAGSNLLLNNPTGYGLIHHSFGSLAIKTWPDFIKPNNRTRGATHSGWLDFTLGMGFPGFLLIIVPLWVSWSRCNRYKNRFWCDYASWTIPALTLAFAITELSVGHMIELLFFLTAFYCGLGFRLSLGNLNFSNRKTVF